MTAAEYYTYQFYTWEYRGRGWHVSESPVQLEAPFIPFFYHGHQEPYIDDGKRHTLISKFLENIKGKKPVPTFEVNTLDYKELDPFTFDEIRDLAAIQVKLPKERKITPEKMKAFLTMLSSNAVPISFEIIGTSGEIIIQFVCDETYAFTVETYLIAYFPDCAVIHADHFIHNILQETGHISLIDFGLKEEFFRPLHIPKSFMIDPLTALFGVLEQLESGQQAGIQILFQGAVNQWRNSIINSVTLADGTSFFSDDPLAPKIALEKVQGAFFGVTIRAFGQGASPNDASQILEKVSYAIINASHGPFNQLMPLASGNYDFETRLDDIYLRASHRLGMILNVNELSTILHFPSENIVSRKLCNSSRTTAPVPGIAKNKPFLLGENQHNGIITNVAFGIEERVKHTHIIGATGTGKSTLIANLILQDIQKGLGVVLFDPHGDLIDDVIARLPEDRMKDVVLLDPSDTEFPVAFNILQAHTDIEREILSSDLVASFRRYATSWGDQMSAVFGNAIQAILENKGGGTLHDLRKFLIEKEFRQAFLKNVTDPTVLYYWQKEFPLLKTNSIGPILTRLDSFLRPKSIRNMVIQNKGLDFESLLNSNKILLFKLSQGLIGMENSFLLGSVLLSKIHQAIFRRQQQSTRHPIFLYLDEFHNFITPSIKEMLSGVRKYNVGLTLSHQDLQQIQREDTELLNSVLSNTNARIVFRVGEPDAKSLQDGFSHFDFSDLQNLGRGEAIISIEQPQYDCSLTTLPLPAIAKDERTKKIDSIIALTRKNYATPKQEVERLLFESLHIEIAHEKPKDIISVKQPLSNEIPIPNEAIPVKEATVLEPPHEPEVFDGEKDLSTHRYLQTLIKKMAESYGYKGTIEMPTADSSGSVDILLEKEGKSLAVEICVTTDAIWEMHNIQKCLAGQYTEVISVCADKKRLEAIQKKCSAGIPGFDAKPVHFFTPDELLLYLKSAEIVTEKPTQKMMKGYRVNVSYEAISKNEMDSKRKTVATVIMQSLRKQQGKS